MAKTRIQFDFTDEALRELDELKEITGSSRAAVIRQGLRMLQWTIEQTQVNRGIVLVEKDGRQREVVFPFLSRRKLAATSE